MRQSKSGEVRSQNKYRVQYSSRKYPCIGKLCVSFLSGHNPLMIFTVNTSGFLQIVFTNRTLVHPMRPLTLKSKAICIRSSSQELSSPLTLKIVLKLILFLKMEILAVVVVVVITMRVLLLCCLDWGHDYNIDS